MCYNFVDGGRNRILNGFDISKTRRYTKFKWCFLVPYCLLWVLVVLKFAFDTNFRSQFPSLDEDYGDYDIQPIPPYYEDAKAYLELMPAQRGLEPLITSITLTTADSSKDAQCTDPAFSRTWYGTYPYQTTISGTIAGEYQIV